MKERPILFNAPMVKAILEGRKTQTRRVVNPQPEGKTLQSNLDGKWLNKKFNGLLLPKIEDLPIHCPYGKIGDQLWVRETWSTVNLYGEIALAYKADSEVIRVVENESFQDEDGLINYDDPRLEKYSFAAWADDLLEGKEGYWKPSIHMPRWASRILLEITNIRVERLNDISKADAIAEGVDKYHNSDFYVRYGFENDWCANAFASFAYLWESVYGKESWTANPWVWVVEFEVIQGGAA